MVGWLIYGLLRTRDGYSKAVGAGDTVFTVIGFVGLYFVLGVLFFYLVGREIYHGPDAPPLANNPYALNTLKRIPQEATL